MVNIKFAVNRAKSYLMEFFPEKKIVFVWKKLSLMKMVIFGKLQ